MYYKLNKIDCIFFFGIYTIVRSFEHPGRWRFIMTPYINGAICVWIQSHNSGEVIISVDLPVGLISSQPFCGWKAGVSGRGLTRMMLMVDMFE